MHKVIIYGGKFVDKLCHKKDFLLIDGGVHTNFLASVMHDLIWMYYGKASNF